MRDDKNRSKSAWLGLRVLIPSLGLSVAGCASVSQDVDAYYRQMAVNYQEAIDKAKIEEMAAQKKAKVLAATGDLRNSRKAHRDLDSLRSWEDHCAWEKKRFEKAAEWMESHFKIDTEAVREEVRGADRPEGSDSALPESVAPRDSQDPPPQ